MPQYARKYFSQEEVGLAALAVGIRRTQKPSCLPFHMQLRVGTDWSKECHSFYQFSHPNRVSWQAEGGRVCWHVHSW